MSLAIKTRRQAHYKIILAIVSNPHTENPNELIEAFRDDDIPDYVNNEALDKSGFERLKLAMADNPRLIIKS